VPVLLANHASSEIRGEVTVISPFGTWAGEVSIGPRTQPFALAPGESTEVRVTATADPAARSGAHWWALFRVTGHGRLHYTPSIGLRVADRS
jgi:hypothetical protein